MSESEDKIQEESISSEKNTNISSKKSIPGIILKWVLRLFLLLIILIIGLLLFIQTDLFNGLALDFILEKVNESLEKKQSVIHASSLSGNIFKGIKLEDGSIKVKEDTLLKFRAVELKYDIWSLFDKEIKVNKVLIEEPEINLTNVRNEKDSLELNLNYLLRSDEIDEDTTKSEFDWGIIAEEVQIRNGSFRFLENKNSPLPIREIKMRNLDTFDLKESDITGLNLNLSAKYFPDNKEININSLSFNTNSKLNVKNLTFKAEIDEDKNETVLKNFSLSTSRSDLTINYLLMKGLNPFDKVDYEEFEKNYTEIELETERFNFDDLSYFLPQLNFLDSTVALKLKANGEYSNLNITDLTLNTPNSKYNFAGNVKNLEKPEKLFLDVTGTDLKIDPADAKLILPGLSIPDYSHVGVVSIPYVTFKGEPDRFTTRFDFKSNAGNADGEAYLDLKNTAARYKGDISVSNVNIGKIIKNKELESNINGRFNVDATGFDYKTATGRLNYSLKNTKFYGQNITSSDGQINFNKANLNLELTYNADAVKAKTKGRVNISNLNNISYDLKGTVSGLNISGFTEDNSQNSNLNFDFDINGRGTEPDAIAGNFRLNLNPSTYSDYIIPATPLDVEIDNSGNIRSITAKSEFADLSFKGDFNINELINVITANAEKIRYDLTSVYFPDSASQTVQTFSSSCDNFYLDYDINVKNLEPLYTFTGGDTVRVYGSIRGIISDSCGLFSLTSDGLLRNIKLNDSTFISDSLFVNVNLSNDINSTGPEKLNLDMKVFSNRLSIGNFPLDSTNVSVNIIEGNNNFALNTKRDSTIRFVTEGMVEDSLRVKFDTMDIAIRELRLINNKDLIVKYGSVDSSSWLDFRKFALNFGNQKLSLAGIYSFNDTSNIKISTDNLKISTIQRLINPDADTSGMLAGNLRRIEIDFKGSLENPNLYLEANSDIMKVGNTRIGRLDAILNYNDEMLRPDISFYNINNTGNIKVFGLFPFFNPLKPENEDSALVMKKLTEANIDLNVLANNFQLKVFQQLLPYTSNLEGKLDGKIILKGTASKPLLNGNMDVNEGKFFVTLNKMKYNFFAKLKTNDEKLIINNAKVFFTSEPSRFISATGYVDFTNLSLNDLFIELSGDMKAFDKKSGQTELGISGDLWVGSGTPKLQLRGNSERFDLTGNLVLIKGNVVFNPFVQEAYNIYSDNFTYGVMIDSLKSLRNPYGKIITQSMDSDVVIKNLNLNPFEKILYVKNNTHILQKAKGKEGMFYYNIFVKTTNDLYLKFIVNEKSQQEFFGNIDAALYLDNHTDYKMKGNGTVTLGDNCYYKFFRKFDAKGKVTFEGPVINPTLDIEAQYKGYATTGSGPTGEQNLEDVIIDMLVTGYAMNPTLKISIDKNGRKESGPNATSDAISFLLFGKFQDQLSFEQSSSFGASLGASLLSNYVSSSLEEIFPFLLNTSFSYVDSPSGSVAENTDVRFTAAIGDAIVRFGGLIFKDFASADIVIDYPLNKLLKIEALSNNLFLRLEKVYDPFIDQSDISNTTGTRAGALIFYRIKF
ncbi:MAG: hypothetical protein HGGPFJEG_02267 [Ignavibacteria bacterium]|nr:hypothetical protein [Ignavibacteria bacterium]